MVNNPIIVTAGMYRSASTYQYNIIRLALLSKYDNVGAYFIDDYKGQAHDAIVIKAHRYNKRIANLATHVITSIRDKAEIVESMQRVKEIKEANPESVYGRAARPDKVGQFLGWFRFWNLKAVYTQQYEDVKSNPLKVVSETLIACGLYDVNPEAVLAQLEELKPPKSGVDKTTFLIAKHITK